MNRAARVSAAAHGGQIVASSATADLVRDDLAAEVSLVDLGEHRLRDLGRSERIVQVTHPELPSEFPPLRSLDAIRGTCRCSAARSLDATRTWPRSERRWRLRRW